MLHFIVIRHGETAWNHQNRIQGNTDIPLNETGLAQAADLAAHLHKTPLAALYTSPLQRARQTARPMAAHHAMEPVILTALSERTLGPFEGLTPHEAAQRFPDLWQGYLSRAKNFDIPGGESIEAFHHRLDLAFHSLLRSHLEGCIALVTHGGVLDYVFRRATGINPYAPRSWALPNISINLIDASASTWKLLTWGAPPAGF